MFSTLFLSSWQFAFYSFFQLLMPHLYNNNLRTLYQFFFMHCSPHVQVFLTREETTCRSSSILAGVKQWLYGTNLIVWNGTHSLTDPAYAGYFQTVLMYWPTFTHIVTAEEN